MDIGLRRLACIYFVSSLRVFPKVSMERKVCLNEHGNRCRIFRRESIPSCRTGGKSVEEMSI